MNAGVLHVRYAYKGFDVPFERLGVAPSYDERRIKQALARHLVVPLAWLSSYAIERHGDGNITLRLESFD